ncbi:four helix bundle protein, partial [Candidatus Collierbacteria bacterium RIFOXYD1_FULL_40_9]
MEIDITKKIKNFIDLNAWRSGHVLVLEIYKITQKFPTIEKFGLSDQIRRTTVSITSNISEGFSRQTKKDKLNFYHISLGSLSEVQNQIIIARDLKY